MQSRYLRSLFYAHCSKYLILLGVVATIALIIFYKGVFKSFPVQSSHVPSPTDMQYTIKGDTDIRFSRNCPNSFNLGPEIHAKYGMIKQQSRFNHSDKLEFKERVLILTPVSNSGKWLHHYFRVLCSLSYPHELISVALGEDSSKDRTYEIAQVMAASLRNYFFKVQVFHFKYAISGKPRFNDRHEQNWQLHRRSHMAKSRNQLLAAGLEDEDWVLWIDSDVEYMPPDIIQHLMSAHADVTATSCMSKQPDGSVRAYDLNSWQETPESISSLKLHKDHSPKYLMLEGYDKSMRKHLPSIKNEGPVVKLDGVGGCTLLVRADCHKKGLIFPPFVFDNHIETEGMAKMAAEMNFTVRGLPFTFVFHM